MEAAAEACRQRRAARRCPAALVALLAAIAVAAGPQQLIGAAEALRSGEKLMPVRSGNVAHFVLNITLARASPACGPMRSVILINGVFQPVLYANVNDTIKFTINNRLPKAMPDVSSGISIHIHGFSMWNEAAWADGTAFLTQCPVPPGGSYTYSFLADESPGSYLWHDHNALNRANGLQGALVLGLPRGQDIPVPVQSDGERVLFLSDWFNREANVIGMQLNRPFDSAKVTNDTGSYQAVGVADALLINGKGVAMDCNLTRGNYSAKQPWFAPICNVAKFSWPAGTGGSGGCKHEVITVQRGKNYRVRIMNAGTQQYLTVCFEKHAISLLAADTTPLDSPEMPRNCVDINSGQRYDINLTANQPPGLYWISVHTQYSALSPSAYAVLRYTEAPASSGSLPRTPTPQPSAVLPWDADTASLVSTSGFILGLFDNYDYDTYWSLYRHRGGYDGILNPMVAADQTIVFNMTSPIMSNGAVKWAMNNVAMPSSPPCSALMDDVVKDPTWLSKQAAPTGMQARQASTQQLLSVTTYSSQASGGVLPGGVYETVTLKGSGAGGSPVRPVAGMHVVELDKDAVVDIVINNLASGAMNGDFYSSTNTSRTFSMQHPMHLHGHKFWVLGTGSGVYTPSRDFENLNFGAPILRDTATVPPSGWMLIRFRANNPGLWPLHCHILWHSFMGQQVVLAEAMGHVPKRAERAAACPTSCRSSFAGYTRSWVTSTYNTSKYPLPS